MCQLDQVVIVVGPNEFVILNVSVEARNGKNQKEKKTEGERRERRSWRPTKSNKAKKSWGLDFNLFNPRGRLQKRMLGIVGNESQDELQTQS